MTTEAAPRADQTGGASTENEAILGVEGAMMGDVLTDPDALRPFLGRDRELADLCDLVGIGGAGGQPRPRSVLVAGDAGVGKTRLLTELLD
ncbi:MAG TPA: ATP-binding protein, partial [Nocardioidaceae bacterium]|nr:ATP-binding protein [Nocardioidaceae bacterium]